MNWSKGAALAVFILAGVSSAYAQGILKGTVSDSLGAAINGAKVTLQKGDSGEGNTTTGGEGAFTFSTAAAGRYHVQVEAPGFASYTGPDVFIGSSGTTTIDIVMQISTLKQDVVVSATGSGLSVAQVGASVTLIDSEDIATQNKLDVLENLRQVSGVQIVQTSQRGGATSLFIRGGESSFNKVMIDGVPSNAIGGAFNYAQLSNGGVQSVEVLKGPNSVLFGADALAGVVSVTTARGTTPLPELKISADGGNFGTTNYGISLGGVFRQFDYFSQYSRFDTRGSYQNNFFHNSTYAGNFGWQPDEKTDLRVTYRRNWTGAGSPNGLLFFGIADDSAGKNQNTYLSATARHQTTSRWHNMLRFAFGQFNSTYSNPTPTGTIGGFGDYLGNVMTILGANGYSVTGRAILDFSFPSFPQTFASYEARRSLYGQSDYELSKDWTTTFGFRYEHENGSGLTRDNYSYFMEGHGNVGRRVYLTGGLGLEDNAVFGFAASPRVSAAYYLRRPSADSFFGASKLRFNFGRGIKEMSTFQQRSELFTLLTPAQRSQFGVGPIGPERSRAFDFGIEQGLWNGRARVDLTFFHNRFYDLITFLNRNALVSVGVSPEAADAASAAAFGAYVNASSTTTKGMEIQFITELGYGLRLQGNYTYLDPVVTKAFGSPAFGTAFPGISIGAFSPLQGARPFNRAPHSGSLGVTYIHNKFSGAFTGYMVGRRDGSTFLSDPFFGNSLLLPNQDLAPAYQKFDLSGRYALKPSMSLYTGIENLFSQHYQAVLGFPAAPFTLRAGVTFTIGGESWGK